MSSKSGQQTKQFACKLKFEYTKLWSNAECHSYMQRQSGTVREREDGRKMPKTKEQHSKNKSQNCKLSYSIIVTRMFYIRPSLNAAKKKSLYMTSMQHETVFVLSLSLSLSNEKKIDKANWALNSAKMDDKQKNMANKFIEQTLCSKNGSRWVPASWHRAYISSLLFYSHGQFFH